MLKNAFLRFFSALRAGTTRPKLRRIKQLRA